MSTFAIRMTPNYFAGDLNGNDEIRLMISPSAGHTLVFSARSDADALVRMLSDTGNGYVLSHNQYAPPEYAVVETASKTAPVTLLWAMQDLGLQYDFRPDGSRIEA